MAARIVMSTFGSLGDLYPYLAVARELRRRGHTVTVARFEAYRERVMTEGLEFHRVRPDIDPNDKEELRRVMDKKNGPTYLLRNIVFRFLRETFVDCREAARGADLIITHQGGLRDAPGRPGRGTPVGIGRALAGQSPFGPRCVGVFGPALRGCIRGARSCDSACVHAPRRLRNPALAEELSRT
jgi:hypothetical protein